jgi:hypothetical protein
VVYEALFRQGRYYGMKPSSGMIFVGVIFAGKPDMTGLPVGQGSTDRGNMRDVVGEIDQAGRVWNMLQVC